MTLVINIFEGAWIKFRLQHIQTSILACLMMLFSVAPAHATESLALNHDLVTWSKLKYSATAFFVTADTLVSLHTVESGLVEIGSGVGADSVLIPQQKTMLRMDTQAGTSNKKKKYQLWFDYDGSILQRKKINKGKKNEIKISRYFNCGYYKGRKKFKGDNFDGEFNNWSDVKNSKVNFPKFFCDGASLLEVNTLLYLISALEPNDIGDEYDVAVISRGEVFQISLKIVKETEIDVDYTLNSGASEKSINIETKVLKIKLVALKESKKFNFLGLKGDIYIYLDPINRLIVRISGEVKVVGRLDVNLKQAFLK